MAVFALIGCAQVAKASLSEAPWPIVHGNTKGTGLSQFDTSKLGGAIKWRFKAEGQIETSPVIDKEGDIYFADQKCNLYAIDKNGKEKWRFSGGKPVTSKEWGGESCAQSSPAIAEDGTIYFLPMTGKFFAVSPDGKEKWSYPIFMFKNAWSSPSIDKDGTIYVGSEMYPPRETGKPEEKHANVYAINPDGTLKWEYSTGSNWSTGTAAIADDGVIFTTTGLCEGGKCENAILAINPDGTKKWSLFPENGVPEGSPTIAKDGTVYITAKGKDDPRKSFFYALNPADGSTKWKMAGSAGMSITPGIDSDGTIYFGDWDGVFFALNPDGSEKWRVQTPKAYETLSSSPAIGADGTIYFGSITGQFFAYDRNGKEKWQFKTEGGGIVASPAIGEGGIVYVTTVPGELIAFGPGKNGASTSSGSATSNQPQKANLGFIILNLIGGLLIVSCIVLLVVKRRKIAFVCGAIGIIVIAGGFFIFHDEQSSKLEQYSCPKNIYQSQNGYYLSESSGDKKDIPQVQVDWIKSNCSETIWPNNNTSNNSDNKQKTDRSTNVVGDSANCPHHIYGTWENGFYGAYDTMTTRDLTTEESKWVEQNCPNTTWPEQYWKK